MVCVIVLRATSLPSTDRTPVPPLPKPGPSYLKSNATVCLPGASAAGPSHRKRSTSKKLYTKTGLPLQVETMATATAPERIDHAFCASLRYFDPGGDGVRLAGNVGGAAVGKTKRFSRVGEYGPTGGRARSRRGCASGE